MSAKRKETCRLRKVACVDCGYVARVARSWMAVGLLGCPCGGELVPESPADLAFIGRISEMDVPGPLWTAICRENGWEASVRRSKGTAAMMSRRGVSDVVALAPRTAAPICAFAGCGKFVGRGADRCSAGHGQHEHAAPAEAMAF